MSDTLIPQRPPPARRRSLGLVQSVRKCFRKYADFDGRATRAEFWYFFLFVALVQFLCLNLPPWASGNAGLHFGVQFGVGSEASWAMNITTAVLFIPFVAVLVKRFHDTGTSARWVLIAPFAVLLLISFARKLTIVPAGLPWPTFALVLALLVGLLIITLRKSQSDQNAYGPNPHEVTS